MSSSVSWDALNWPRPNKGTAWGENCILQGLFGEKNLNNLTDCHGLGLSGLGQPLDKPGSEPGLVTSTRPHRASLFFSRWTPQLVSCLSHSWASNFHFYVIREEEGNADSSVTPVHLDRNSNHNRLCLLKPR